MTINPFLVLYKIIGSDMLVMHRLISLPYLTSGMKIAHVSSAIFAQNSDGTFIISTGQGKLFSSIFFRSIQGIFFSSLWRLSSSGPYQVFSGSHW